MDNTKKIRIAKSVDDVHEILKKYSECMDSLRNESNLRDLSTKFFRFATTMELITNGHGVGFATVYHNDTSERIAYLTRIAVLPKYEGQGNGTELLLGVIDVSKRSGMKHIRLEVSENNTRAIRLYKNLGFSVEGVSKPGCFYMKKDI